MFVSSKTFMELVEKVTRMELEHKHEIKRLNERIETLEKRPIIVESKVEPNGKKDYDITEIYDDLMNGVKDEKLGRVRLTDGTD